MPTEEDLRSWLQQMAARDEAALSRFYRALSGAVFAFVQRRLDNPQDAEAVVVDTLHEVWKKAASFNGQSQVKTWVLGIARHKLLDVLRQRGARAGQDDIDDHAETLASEDPGPFAQLAQRQQQEWVAQCMARLPAEQRESLHLLFFEALAIDEIADVLACPAGTVKTRVFHAKRKIRDCLARWLRATGGALGAELQDA
jgi:RNA polymerase sigma-70 factor (ECF subfamily)